MNNFISDQALKQLFEHARTPVQWIDKAVDEELLIRLYELTKFGPTSGNCQPGRFTFIKHPVSKEKLRPALSIKNIEPVMSAPLVVIVAHDPLFYDYLDELNPHIALRTWFAEDMPFAEETAIRNATLQGGYLIMAARALGLDVWPMSGFDNVMVNQIFFEEQGWQSNFIICLGYADHEHQKERLPRLNFDEACLVL